MSEKDQHSPDPFEEVRNLHRGYEANRRQLEAEEGDFLASARACITTYPTEIYLLSQSLNLGWSWVQVSAYEALKGFQEAAVNALIREARRKNRDDLSVALYRFGRLERELVTCKVWGEGEPIRDWPHCLGEKRRRLPADEQRHLSEGEAAFECLWQVLRADSSNRKTPKTASSPANATPDDPPKGETASTPKGTGIEWKPAVFKKTLGLTGKNSVGKLLKEAAQKHGFAPPGKGGAGEHYVLTDEQARLVYETAAERRGQTGTNAKAEIKKIWPQDAANEA